MSKAFFDEQNKRLIDIFESKYSINRSIAKK